MDAKNYIRVIFESRTALRVWCLVAGLALAPMPILHAYPIGFLIYLFDPSPPGWTSLTLTEARDFTLLGLPLAPIFLAWALPGAVHPGVPLRSIAMLWFLGRLQSASAFFRESLLWRQHCQRLQLVGVAASLGHLASRYAVADWARRHRLASASHARAATENSVSLDTVHLRHLGRQSLVR